MLYPKADDKNDDYSGVVHANAVDVVMVIVIDYSGANVMVMMRRGKKTVMWIYQEIKSV